MSLFNGHGPLIRVVAPKKHHNPIKDTGFETLDHGIKIPQSALEEAYPTRHGLLFLQLLKAVDFAYTTQKRGVMLMGYKHRLGGFTLFVRVPMPTRSSKPIPISQWMAS